MRPTLFVNSSVVATHHAGLIARTVPIPLISEEWASDPAGIYASVIDARNACFCNTCLIDFNRAMTDARERSIIEPLIAILPHATPSHFVIEVTRWAELAQTLAKHRPLRIVVPCMTSDVISLVSPDHAIGYYVAGTRRARTEAFVSQLFGRRVALLGGTNGEKKKFVRDYLKNRSEIVAVDITRHLIGKRGTDLELRCEKLIKDWRGNDDDDE